MKIRWAACCFALAAWEVAFGGERNPVCPCRNFIFRLRMCILSLKICILSLRMCIFRLKIKKLAGWNEFVSCGCGSI